MNNSFVVVATSFWGEHSIRLFDPPAACRHENSATTNLAGITKRMPPSGGFDANTCSRLRTPERAFFSA
jgi:hypothetical protein